jgi:predicted ester cyclase
MDPKVVVRRFWASYCAGDLDMTWSTYVAPHLLIHQSAGLELTRQSWLDLHKQLVASFGHIEVEIVDQVSDGDRVATRWELTGIQRADFMGVRSSGRTGTLNGVTFEAIENDQIAEHWAEVGIAAFLNGLGATP